MFVFLTTFRPAPETLILRVIGCALQSDGGSPDEDRVTWGFNDARYRDSFLTKRNSSTSISSMSNPAFPTLTFDQPRPHQNCSVFFDCNVEIYDCKVCITTPRRFLQTILFGLKIFIWKNLYDCFVVLFGNCNFFACYASHAIENYSLHWAELFL